MSLLLTVDTNFIKKNIKTKKYIKLYTDQKQKKKQLNLKEIQMIINKNNLLLFFKLIVKFTNTNWIYKMLIILLIISFKIQQTSLDWTVGLFLLIGVLFGLFVERILSLVRSTDIGRKTGLTNWTLSVFAESLSKHCMY